MIAYIEGRLLETTENSCIIATESGLGYEVYAPSHSLAALPEKGQMLRFYTSMIVREDSQELFGFDTWEERQSFLILISISKIGARTALSILSIFRPDDLYRLVQDEDIIGFTRVPGIGKKTAQHALLELKYKLKVSALSTKAGQSPVTSLYKDTLTGLTGLGYTEEEAGPILQEILHKEPDLDVSSALRACLKNLAKKS